MRSDGRIPLSNLLLPTIAIMCVTNYVNAKFVPYERAPFSQNALLDPRVHADDNKHAPSSTESPQILSQQDIRQELMSGETFEGDIVLTAPQAAAIAGDLATRHKRKISAQLARRWPLPVPFMFDNTHSGEERWRIRQALAYWEELTCVTFRETPTADRTLLFTKGTGCWSYVGFTQQINQTISIGSGCQSNGTIAHEVGHALGFWHEQSRPDRDDLVIIHKGNVTSGKMYNFARRTWGEIRTMDVPYDLGSDMHYGGTFYAQDENSTLITVEPRDPHMTRVIGQRQELSFFDVMLANKAYCQDHCKQEQLEEPCQRSGYQDPLRCDICRCPDGFSGKYCQRVAAGKNAFCGGTYQAGTPGTINSPDYLYRPYGPQLACTWLLKASYGEQVYIEFQGEFGLSGHTDVCKDYVEVRYNTSLALTGARFCCADPPLGALRSASNEMMLLLRTFPESRICDDLKYPWKCRQVFTGFSLKYYTRSCGGCSATAGALQTEPACARMESYTCSHTWRERQHAACSMWWYSAQCTPRWVTKVRYGTCYRDGTFCCAGWRQVGTECQREGHTPALPTTLQTTLPTTTRTAPHLHHIVWSEWSAWGACSQQCGGGVRERRRLCVRPMVCGLRGLQVERQSCGTTGCYKICQKKVWKLCDFWVKCRRTTYAVCGRSCNRDYQLEGAMCAYHPH